MKQERKMNEEKDIKAPQNLDSMSRSLHLTTSSRRGETVVHGGQMYV